MFSFYTNYPVIIQLYNTYVQSSDVIQGNDVILKCEIPSFVTDFVHIDSWEDDSGKVYPATSITTQGIENEMFSKWEYFFKSKKCF